MSDDRRRDSRHRDDDRRHDGRYPEGKNSVSAGSRDLAPGPVPGDVYGPFQPRDGFSSEASIIYEEFSCEDALLATVFDADRPNRWIQTTMVVPVEE